jgi:hypothetical protein
MRVTCQVHMYTARPSTDVDTINTCRNAQLRIPVRIDEHATNTQV